jgi:MFS family permease
MDRHARADHRQTWEMSTILDPRRAVRRLAWGRGITVGGDFAGRTALLVEVFARTHSTTWLSITMLANLGLSALVSPLAGWIADRFDRRWVMLSSETAAGFMWLLMALVSSHVSLAALVGLNLAAALLNSPFQSASSAAIPNLAGPAHLDWANRTLASAAGVALVIGPFAGGALAGTLGARGVYAINAATFLASAVFVYLSQGDFGGSTSTHEAAGLLEGFRIVRHSRVLQKLFLVSMLWDMSFGICMVADLPLADSFGAGAIGFALISTVWGVGSIAGSAWLARRYGEGREHTGMAVGTALMVIGIGGTAVPSTFVAIVLLQSLGGLGSGLVRSPWSSAVQRSTDDRTRGRVFALSTACDQGFLMVGFVLAGPLGTRFGAQQLYVWPGVAMVIAVLVATTARVTSAAGSSSEERITLPA